MKEKVEIDVLDKLTVVPSKFKAYFGDDVETFKAELKLAIKNLERTEELMAQMFVDQTEASMKAIRLEVADINGTMNKVMSTRFNSANKMTDLVAVTVWGTLMAAFSDQTKLTPEQRAMMIKTGAYHDLMRSGVSR
uniref:Uncharacterized protein n=1 Tax=Pseudomonas phage Nican01 TaxID=3138540 RepID=A0AAU6W0Q7_9CAUD